MAFNWQTFRTRTGTAIIFAVVMLAGLLWNQWLFLLLFSIIHFGCWYEYQQLLEKIDPDYKQITPFHRYGVMIAGWCILLFFTGDDSFSDVLSLHAIAWWVGLVLILVLPIMELLFSRHINLRNIRHSILGLLYISLSFGLLVQMRWEDMRLPMLIIFSIWINDTMAYIVGSLIGKTPLSAISPKKTWEGTIGGIMLSVLVMAIISYTTNYFYSLTHSVIIALIAAVFGTFGDLLESKIKRMANVKDSGSFMPGHGGFLDRFDSILLATPFVWIYVNLFLR
ncbi:phosphatidate cytidylyltransferase [Flavihumibacter sp.]|jgi:phosphatidate cytidylyltransferase|uniref:phosphatidate cytidylyltransferase n=1 Tax=Flavihumibacter sp. TaxID=1913981 RepID=UPI002FC975F4|nr:phosphatidate cytidylyltransferase [Flavihumibacter sediminis]